MVGHYTNVNDVCRQSWKRQRPTPSRQAPASAARPAGPGSVGVGAGLRNYASHTDSEQEGESRRDAERGWKGERGTEARERMCGRGK